MGRTAGQFCSRDSMYRFQDEAEMPPPMPLVDAEAVRNTAMTWQQKQEFGTTVKANERKSKGVHWQPFDINAVKDPAVTETIGNGDSWTEQRAKLDIGTSRRPREKTTSIPPVSSPPASIDPSLPNSINDTETAQRNRPKRQNRRKKPAEFKTMTPPPEMPPLPEKLPLPEKSSLPKTAFVPPHLREGAKGTQTAQVSQSAQIPKRAYILPHLRKHASPTTTNDEAATSSLALATNAEQTSNPAPRASTVDSTNSKLGNTGNLHSTPYRASHASTTSVHTTAKNPKPSKAGTPRVSTPNVPEKVATTPETETANDESYPGWDVPKPSPPPAAPKAGNPRWPRTRGLPKKNVWPKSREMKALPSESDSDGGVTFKSDSNGDPNYDVKKLMDWNGDWLPPPEQWSARKGHSSRHFGQGIEQWINGHPNECTQKMEIEAFFEEGNCKEIVPRYWIVSTIEQKSLGEFWKLMPMRQPLALSDVSAHPPFWERYEDTSKDCFFIEGLAVSEEKVDPDDPNNHFGRADLLASATQKMEGIKARDQRQRAKQIAKQNRVVPDTKPVGPQPADRRIKLESNVYFRPVQPADIGGIAELYNRWVKDTIFADEFEPLEETHIRDRVDTIVRKGLPYLVAVARGSNQAQGPLSSDQAQVPSSYVKDRVVGYAYLEDYRNQASMYRFTFELELYVHPGFQDKKIASCLLDRLLEMCNTGYNACGGYDYLNEYEYLKNGPGRVIKTIILKVHKEHGEKDDDTAEFLKRFKFQRSGRIPRIGYKLGKEVDVFLYNHTTTETVEPASRPTVPLDL